MIKQTVGKYNYGGFTPFGHFKVGAGGGLNGLGDDQIPLPYSAYQTPLQQGVESQIAKATDVNVIAQSSGMVDTPFGTFKTDTLIYGLALLLGAILIIPGGRMR